MLPRVKGRLIFLVFLCGLAVTPAHAAQGAMTPEGWQVGPNVDAPGCSAHKTGGDLATTLRFNSQHQLILSFTRPEWSWQVMHRLVRLTLDDGKPVAVGIETALNLVLLKVSTPDRIDALRGAHLLHWGFPWGKYTADVDGLGRALDWVQQCSAQNR